VVDAIDRKNMRDLREELGDLLLQIVFQSQLAGEHFGIDDVIGAICDKMVRRHPHVFGGEQAADSAAVRERWEALKAAEKRGRGVLDGVPSAMPALLRASRVGEKAAHIGLDWPDAHGARRKLDEELGELDAALAQADVPAVEGRGAATEQIEAELGDVLFAVVNLARKQQIDAEAALRRSIDKFAERVRFVEGEARERGVEPATLSPAELDRLWTRAKEARG
jgi:MazG family protein